MENRKNKIFDTTKLKWEREPNTDAIEHKFGVINVFSSPKVFPSICFRVLIRIQNDNVHPRIHARRTLRMKVGLCARVRGTVGSTVRTIQYIWYLCWNCTSEWRKIKLFRQNDWSPLLQKPKFGHLVPPSKCHRRVGQCSHENY